MNETPPQLPVANGRAAGWLNAVKGLTLTNVAVIALLILIAIPAYTVWKALNDEHVMDRLMSTYEELGMQQGGCLLRHAKQRGGPDIWAISSAFAAQGTDRWAVTVSLPQRPTDAEITSYCEALKLISDKLMANDQ